MTRRAFDCEGDVSPARARIARDYVDGRRGKILDRGVHGEEHGRLKARASEHEATRTDIECLLKPAEDLLRRLARQD